MKNKIKVIIFILCVLIYGFSKESTLLTNLIKSEDVAVSESLLKVHVIDVGQADSIFIELPNKETMLIDAGNNSDDETVVNYIKKLNYERCRNRVYK